MLSLQDRNINICVVIYFTGSTMYQDEMADKLWDPKCPFSSLGKKKIDLNLNSMKNHYSFFLNSDS